ncbi:MAG: transketolase [Bacteroidales bacterium]|nr:transketolase [Bacteroidales bacterium]
MDTKELARAIRISSLKMVHNSNSSHIGGALSMTDMLAVLYNEVLHYDAHNPKDPDRDRLVLSKGHTCAALYSVLGLKGFYPMEELETFCQNGSLFEGHVSYRIPGVEISSGSLGHGFPIACGMAYGAKVKKQNFRTYVIVGDGEMNEGSNWEALLFGAHHKLDNLCAFIDRNKMQALGNSNDILNLEPLKAKLEAFNWNVLDIDGNDYDQLRAAFKNAAETKGKPTIIIANTIKGKGVPYMENTLKWHYCAPNDDLLNKALEVLQ